MVFTAKELRKSTISRFLFRHCRYSSVVLSTGRRINFFRDRNGVITSSIVYVGKLSNFERIEIQDVESLISKRSLK